MGDVSHLYATPGRSHGRDRRFSSRILSSEAVKPTGCCGMLIILIPIIMFFVVVEFGTHLTNAVIVNVAPFEGSKRFIPRPNLGVENFTTTETDLSSFPTTPSDYMVKLGKSANWFVVYDQSGGSNQGLYSIQKYCKDGWRIVVVGGDPRDKVKVDSNCAVYLDPVDQNDLAKTHGFESLTKLPINHTARKNIGYIYAITHGAERVWDFDSENSLKHDPLDIACAKSAQNTIVATVSPTYQCNAFDAYSVVGLSMPTRRARGFPGTIKCNAKKLEEMFLYERVHTETLAVCHSLEGKRPDMEVDEKSNFGTFLSVRFVEPQTSFPFKTGARAMSPFNSRSTFYTRDALWSLFLPSFVPSTMSDIWRSYIMQRLMLETKLSTVFTHSVVDRVKEEHHASANHEKYKKHVSLLIDYLFAWKDQGASTLEESAKSLYKGLSHGGYLGSRDVELINTWLDFLTKQSYELPLLKKQIKAKTCNADWPDLQLFMPGFPGGIPELKEKLVRTMNFFWPKEKIDFVFVFDDRYETQRAREDLVKRLTAIFPPDALRVAVGFNPRTEAKLGGGHDIQQDIQFWADNYTYSDFVGFVDDDTLFSVAVKNVDLFSADGKGAQIGVYAGWEIPRKGNWFKGIGNPFWHYDVPKRTKWALGRDELLRGMTSFPVIMKTAHFKPMREYLLSLKPNVATFDDWFALLRKSYYAQFNIFMNFIWFDKKLRKEYDFHIAGYSKEGANGFLKGNVPPAVAYGSPKEHGMTEEMLLPFPRCAIHGNWDFRGRGKGKDLIERVMRAGYCYSLPVDEPDLERCGEKFDIHTPNEWNQWIFEEQNWMYHPKVPQQHEKWISSNCKREWDQEELARLFPEGLKDEDKF